MYEYFRCPFPYGFSICHLLKLTVKLLLYLLVDFNRRWLARLCAVVIIIIIIVRVGSFSVSICICVFFAVVEFMVN